MPGWIYKQLAASTHMDEIKDDAALARMIKSNGLTGMELVRPMDGAGEWVPVHSLPVFRETLKLASAEDAEKAATKRKSNRMRLGFSIMGGLITMGALGGAMSAASQNGGNPVPALAVVMGVLVVFFAGMGAFVATAKRRPAAEAAVNAAAKPATIKAPAAQPKRVEDVEKALAALEVALKSAPESMRNAVPMASLQESARRLRKNRELLSSLPAESAREALLDELKITKSRAELATDPRTKDALEDQVRALEAHLRSVDDAVAAIAETEARARALLHEVEALRVDVLRAGADSSLDDALLERLHGIRRELEAEAAIEDQLSKTVDTHAMRRAMGPAAQKN